MTMRALFVFFGLFTPLAALAHASSQQLVLLLPTAFYNSVGVIIVLMTALFLMVPAVANRLTAFAHWRLGQVDTQSARRLTSLLSCAVLVMALVAGLIGSRDPLTNPLTLLIWSVWWIVLVVLNGLLGNLWYWLNPWVGACHMMRRAVGERSVGGRPVLSLPDWVGHWPAVIGFLCFSAFLLAHPAPDDPAVLALSVALYWMITLVAMLLFGESAWLQRGEFVTVIMTQLSRSALFGVHNHALHVGVPGWRLREASNASLSLALFVLLMLGTSSFDGFNETFFWLGILGVNPLEFPGRSAVIPHTLAGILVVNAVLISLFALCIAVGVTLARVKLPVWWVVVRLAPTILPIAVGYHFAHYLTTILVTIQYTVASFNDPFSLGWDLFGVGQFYVTTGFFNRPESVEQIYLSQATAVVIAHLISLLCAHRVVASLVPDNKQAIISQLPLAIFMVNYTLFGLWLLSAPRGA